MKEVWYHCILYAEEPFVCFGFASSDGTVTKAAPSFTWMIGKQLNEIKPFLLSNKAIVAEVKI